MDQLSLLVCAGAVKVSSQAMPCCALSRRLTNLCGTLLVACHAPPHDVVRAREPASVDAAVAPAALPLKTSVAPPASSPVSSASALPDNTDGFPVYDPNASETPEPATLPTASPWAAQTLATLSEDPARCAAAVDYHGALERCALNLVGTGNALVLTIVTACGSDSCSTENWLLREPPDNVVALPNINGGGFAFDTTLSFYVMDNRSFRDEQDLRNNFYKRAPTLVKVDLASNKSQPFAACFSPSLSPGGRYFLCRNPQGDLLRVPTAGGKLERFARNQVKGEVAFSPYAFIYPSEAYFYRIDQACFRSGGDDNHEICVPWRETSRAVPAPNKP